MKLVIVLRCWRGLRTLVPGAGRGGCAREVEREVAVERLQRVGRVEHDGVRLGRGLVTKAEVVVEELAPGPSPLRDVVLGEQVLADVVEDTVADVARVGDIGERTEPVRVVRRRDARVVRARLTQRGPERVVPRAVEAAEEQPRHRGRRVRRASGTFRAGRQADDETHDQDDGNHPTTVHDPYLACSWIPRRAARHSDTDPQRPREARHHERCERTRTRRRECWVSAWAEFRSPQLARRRTAPTEHVSDAQVRRRSQRVSCTSIIVSTRYAIATQGKGNIPARAIACRGFPR